MNILSESQIKFVTDLALGAGSIVMSYFCKPNLQFESKSDNSLVSNADFEASAFISSGLRANFPDIKIICEEGRNREAGDLFWLIDPIDGTNEFIKGNAEFTINIALVSNKKPIFGLIYAPAFPDAPLYYVNHQNRVLKYLPRLNQEFFLSKKNNFKNEYQIITSWRTKDEDLENYIRNFIYPNKANIIRLSSSLKFCYLLDDKADIYLHFRKSMEWDTAAGQALVTAFGKKVLDFNHQELDYKKASFANQAFIVI